MTVEKNRQLNNFIFRTISFGAKETVHKENMCAYFVPKYAMHGLFMCRLTPQVRHAELVSASHEPRKAVA